MDDFRFVKGRSTVVVMVTVLKLAKAQRKVWYSLITIDVINRN